MDLIQPLIIHQTTFSLQLAMLVGSTFATNNTNFIFSPISFHTALALVAVGSKGETQKQILSFLRSDSTTDLSTLSSHIANIVLTDGFPLGGPKLTFANGVWIDASLSLKSTFKEIVDCAYKDDEARQEVNSWHESQAIDLKSTFKEVVNCAYKAETKTLDFQTKAEEARQEVNAWVRNITGGLICDMLPAGSVNSNTKFLLGNALYFKGSWNEGFDKSQTKNSEFYLLDGTTIQVPFMTSEENQYISSYDDFEVLRMPYKQGGDKRQFSMYIFLPKARDGISNLAERLSFETGFLNNHVPREKIRVGKLRIPKFNVSFGFEASELLKSMGLVLPFGPEADLTGMVDSAVGQGLSISKILHRSIVEVNEEGTEAAAATIVCSEGSSIFEPPGFVADHPFLFVIREDISGVVLFIGHVMNPQTG